MNYTKYIDALAIMDSVITSAKNISSGGRGEYEDRAKLMHTQWDELYEYVFANFNDPESRRAAGDNSPEVKAELASMKEMFNLNRKEIEEQLYKIPPVILEQCFPVWMARHMLCWCGVPVYPTKLETSTKFHHLYGYMIAAARRARK